VSQEACVSFDLPLKADDIQLKILLNWRTILIDKKQLQLLSINRSINLILNVNQEHNNVETRDILTK